MGKDIRLFVGERNWETVDCRRVHIGVLHGEWCRLDVTGVLNGKGDIVV